MKKERGKKGNKTTPKSFFIKALFAVAFLYIAFTLTSQQLQISKLSKQEADINSKIEAQKVEEAKLKAQLEASQSDEYIERIAREKLGYMKPDEKVFIDASR